MLDLVLWVPKQRVYQVSLKSEMVGFNSLGDSTQNDPKLSHDEGDISTPFLPLSVDFFLFKHLSTWDYLFYLRHHVDVKTSSALPYVANSATWYSPFTHSLLIFLGNYLPKKKIVKLGGSTFYTSAALILLGMYRTKRTYVIMLIAIFIYRQVMKTNRF